MSVYLNIGLVSMMMKLKTRYITISRFSVLTLCGLGWFSIKVKVSKNSISSLSVRTDELQVIIRVRGC